ncbi:hypothetical protein AX16_006128 [Volvariella volvacea WC 439]|nr:hypothetical protein AX16_006128 [Volvariella volvacea WC 439]
MTSPHSNVNTSSVPVAGTSTALPTPASSMPQVSHATYTTQSTMSAILQAHYRRAVSYNHYTLNDYIEFAISLGWDSSSMSWVTVDGQLGLSGVSSLHFFYSHDTNAQVYTTRNIQWDIRTDSVAHLSIERMKWRIYQAGWVPNRIKAYMAAYAAQQDMRSSGSGQQPMLAPATGSDDGASRSGSVLPQNLASSYATMTLAQHSPGLVGENMLTTTASVPSISAANPTPQITSLTAHSIPSSILSQVQWPTTSSQPASNVTHHPTSSINQQAFTYPVAPASIHQHASTSQSSSTTANPPQYTNKGRSRTTQAAGAMNHAMSHPAPSHHPAQSSGTNSATTHQNPKVAATLEEVDHEAEIISHSPARWDVNKAIATVCNEEQTPEARRPSCLQLLSQDTQSLYTLGHYIVGILGQEMYDALCEMWPDTKPQPQPKPRAVNREYQWDIETPATMKEKPFKKRSRVEDNEMRPSSPRTIVQGSTRGGVAATVPTSRASTNGSRSSESIRPVAKRARVSQGDQVVPALSNSVQSQEASEETPSLSEKKNVSPATEGSSSQPTPLSDAPTAHNHAQLNVPPRPEAEHKSAPKARRLPAVNAAARSSLARYVPSPLANEIKLVEMTTTATTPDKDNAPTLVVKALPKPVSSAGDPDPAPASASDEPLDELAPKTGGESEGPGCLEETAPLDVPPQPETPTPAAMKMQAPVQLGGSTTTLMPPQITQATTSNPPGVLDAAGMNNSLQATPAQDAGPPEEVSSSLGIWEELEGFMELFKKFESK